MKTPEIIKKGLMYCNGNHPNCSGCPYDTDEDYENKCLDDLQVDALDYIIQLESRLSQVERERDAAVHDLHVLFSEDGHTCMICDVEKAEAGCMFDCEHQRKWRGVCKENTK